MLKFKVSGMTCGHCTKAVTKAIQSKYPTSVVDVNLSSQTVDISNADDISAITQLIVDAGYDVKEAKKI